MNQKLTFTAFLQDEYSKRFDQLAQKSDTGIKLIEKDLAKLGKTGKQVAYSINDLNKRIEVLTRVKKLTIDTKAIKFATEEIKRLERERDKLEGKGGSGLFGGGLSLGSIAGGYGISRGIGLATNFIKSAVQANMEREQQRISMGVLLGGQKEGDKMIGNITTMASKTPFGTNDLIKATQTMLGFGVAQDKVLPIMQQLGDISGGNNDRFQSLTLAFSQMSSTGRLMGQDLLQMVNAGFNPLNQISQMTGRSMKSLKKDMEDGKISTELVLKAMAKATGEGGLYHGMMDKQSQTTEGRISTLKDEYNELNVVIGEKFKAAVDGGVTALSDIVATVKKWTEIPISQKIQDQSDKLRSLKAQLMDTNLEETRRKEIIAEIKDQYGDYLKNLDLEKASYEDINKALTNTIDLLDKKSKKARLDEIMKDAQDEVTAAYRKRTSSISAIYKQYSSSFPDIMKQEGITTEQRIAMIEERLKQRDKYGNTKYQAESVIPFVAFKESKADIENSQKALKRTTEDIQRQMKDEGLNTLSDTGDSKTKIGKDKSGASSSDDGTRKSSISGSSKITHLTINIDSLVKGGVNIYRETVNAGAAEMNNVVTEQLLTAVNDANLAVSN